MQNAKRNLPHQINSNLNAGLNETTTPTADVSDRSVSTLQIDQIDRNRYVFTAEIKEIIPVSDMTLWRWIKAGKIPEPVYIGKRRCWHLGMFLSALGL